MEQRAKQEKTIRKLKKQLKAFMKKVGELEGNHMALTAHTMHVPDEVSTASDLSLSIFYSSRF